MIEKRPPTPLEIQLETELQEQGFAELELDAADFREVARLLVAHLFEQRGAGGVIVREPSVVIENSEARVQVSAEIAKPVKAQFEIYYVLFNSRLNPGCLMPLEVSVSITANPVAKVALKALQVERQVNSVLHNLNEVICENPPPIIGQNGCEMGDIRLTLENDHLRVQLGSR